MEGEHGTAGAHLKKQRGRKGPGSHCVPRPEILPVSPQAETKSFRPAFEGHLDKP